MSDMRLIVAGAGGRMGRTLVRTIDATPGVVLAGALEAPGSPLLGKDAGVLAGLPANGIELSADAIDSPQALIGAQVKAGVAVRMAVLYELLVGSPVLAAVA